MTSTGTFPFPKCARCGKRVETLWDLGFRPERNGHLFAVECHGAREECLIPHAVLAKGPWTVSAGVAFTGRKQRNS